MKILHAGDLHLGHPQVPDIDTANDLRECLFPRLVGVDLLAITGDVFDGPISFNHVGSDTILDLLSDLLTTCYQHKVKAVRVVQGTFTHDRNQLKTWETLFAKLRIPLDFKVVRTLSLEYLPTLGVNILYLPDNLPFRTKAEVLQQVDDLFTANGIKQVDHVLMHGEFDHTSYSKFITEAYSVKEFQQRCRGWILSGHVHSPQRHERMLYSGSINRLAHNEEDPKGFWMIDNDTPTFVANHSATKFITADYTLLSEVDALLTHHQEIVSQFPSERKGFLRILIRDPHLKTVLREYHHTHYPLIKLTFKRLDQLGVQELFELKAKPSEQLEAPSRQNISTIICNHLSTKGVTLEHQVVEDLLYGDAYA